MRVLLVIFKLLHRNIFPRPDFPKKAIAQVRCTPARILTTRITDLLTISNIRTFIREGYAYAKPYTLDI